MPCRAAQKVHQSFPVVLLVLELVEHAERVSKVGEGHGIQRLQVDRFARVVLFVGVEIQLRHLETAGQTGVFLPALVVVIGLLRSVRTKEHPTRDASVGMRTTRPINHAGVVVVGCIAEDDIVAFDFVSHTRTFMLDNFEVKRYLQSLE